MIIFSESITSRLEYITRFIGNEILQDGFQLTTDKNHFRNYTGPKLNYSANPITTGELFLKPHSLLFESGITNQNTNCIIVDGRKAFFPTSGDFPFDLFAAGFYLLSRYEEYLPYLKDMYGRYAHENSIAYREGFLSYPLVNIWIEQFKVSIQKKFPSINFKRQSFKFIPTYDIDIAWSYKQKGWWRNGAGLLKSLLSADWKMANERIKVLTNSKPDPFDSYEWLNQLHEVYQLKPYYFFLLAQNRGKYDKNIDPSTKAMHGLIRDHHSRYPIGIHPSWHSGDDRKALRNEITSLIHITVNEVLASRQHYIRFTLPETYRLLIEEGIRFEYSMGYGSINGFRASVTSPFYWYDLKEEKQTQLLVFPFCYMEANSYYEQNYSPEQALDEMRHYFKEVKSVNGNYIMIWHNSFLGTANLYKGWREIYEQFVKEVTE